MISVGIDVSKGKSMVCIMKPGGEVLKTPFEIRHTMSELEDNHSGKIELPGLPKGKDSGITILPEFFLIN